MLIEKYNKNQTHWILIEHITFNSSQSGSHDLLESSGMWQLDWCSGWIVQEYDQQVSIVYSTRLTHTHLYIHINIYHIYIYMYIYCSKYIFNYLWCSTIHSTYSTHETLRHGLARAPSAGGPDQGDGPGSRRKLAEFERCAWLWPISYGC